MQNGNHIGWFVIITRWGQWKKISERLSALRIRYFIPPTYNTLVFFRTDKENALNLVNAGQITGRFMIDKGSRTLLEIPEEQMEAFIRVVREYPDTPVTSDIPLTRGMRVRVVRGPLKDVVGEIEETPNGARLLVAVQSLLCTRVSINRADVVPVEDGTGDL